MKGRIHIGTSGYVYSHLRDRFYPRGLPQRDWLSFYARHFDTVELNNPFYRLPEAEQFKAWKSRVPVGFIFAVKVSRFMTHVKRLKDPREPLALLLDRACHLGPYLGPILFQLPAHSSWLEAQVIDRLERAGVALCLHDWSKLQVWGPATADFLYLRRHGARGRYAGSYPPSFLARDARVLDQWAANGKDSYVYFNNDVQAYAVANARSLSECAKHPLIET